MSKNCEMEVRALHFSSISCTSITFPLVQTIGIRRVRRVGGSLDPCPGTGGRPRDDGWWALVMQDAPKGAARLSTGVMRTLRKPTASCPALAISVLILFGVGVV